MKRVLLLLIVLGTLAAHAHAQFDRHEVLQSGKLLFVKRQTYHSSHFYTDFIDGCSRFGGNICVLDVASGKVTDLIPQMKDGIFGRFDLHFDAKKIVFDSSIPINLSSDIYRQITEFP